MTETKTETTIETPTATLATTDTKPGWKTSEFWFSLLATLLTALFASGVLTSSTALAIAGMAATVLTALGYKVSRTLVKTAALLLVVGLFASTQTACKPYAPPSIAPIVDCINSDRPGIDALIASFWPKDGSAPNWSAVESAAIDAGLSVGGCALSEFVQKYLTPAPGNHARAAADGQAASKTLEDYRAKHANGATFRTRMGDL